MDEVSTQIYIDLRADAHEALFDVDWAATLLNRTQETAFYEPAFTLCELWKSASNAFRMPLFLLRSLEYFHDGVFSNHRPSTQVLIQALLANLQNDPILGLRNMQMKNLAKRLAELDGQMTSILQSNPPKFDRDEMWKGIATSAEFALGASALREMCHNSLLSAYENYLKRCLDILLPKEKDATEKERSFGHRMINCFGESVANELHDDQIKLAREYRHVIMHNGGRVDQKAKDKGIKLDIGKKVIITIEALRELSKALRNRIDRVTECSLKKLGTK